MLLFSVCHLFYAAPSIDRIDLLSFLFYCFHSLRNHFSYIVCACALWFRRSGIASVSITSQCFRRHKVINAPSMKCDGKTLYLLQSTQSNGICDFCVAISTFTFNRMAYQRQWLHLRIESSDGSVRHTESSRLGRPLSCNGLEMQTNRFECCPWNEGREREKDREKESSARKIVHLLWSTAFVCVFSIRTPCLVEHSRQTFKFFHLFFFFFVRAAPVFHITFSLFSFFFVSEAAYFGSLCSSSHQINLIYAKLDKYFIRRAYFPQTLTHKQKHIEFLRR